MTEYDSSQPGPSQEDNETKRLSRAEIKLQKIMERTGNTAAELVDNLDKQLTAATRRELIYYLDFVKGPKASDEIIPIIPQQPKIQVKLAKDTAQMLVAKVERDRKFTQTESAGSIYFDAPTPDKPFYIARSVELREIGTSGKVYDDKEPIEAGEVLFHTHVAKNYFGKTDLGDLVKVIQNQGWKDPATMEVNPKRRFYSILSIDKEERQMQLDTYYHDMDEVIIDPKSEMPRSPYGLWRTKPVVIRY